MRFVVCKKKSGMMCRFIFSLFFVLFFAAVGNAQTFDAMAKEYAGEDSVVVHRVSGKELSALRFMMPEQQRGFFKLVDVMVTLELTKCVPEIRQRFYSEIAALSPDGYLAELHDDGGAVTRVFLKFDEKKKACVEIVIAAMDDKTEVALTLLKGKFRESDVKKVLE